MWHSFRRSNSNLWVTLATKSICSGIRRGHFRCQNKGIKWPTSHHHCNYIEKKLVWSGTWFNHYCLIWFYIGTISSVIMYFKSKDSSKVTRFERTFYIIYMGKDLPFSQHWFQSACFFFHPDTPPHLFLPLPPSSSPYLSPRGQWQSIILTLHPQPLTA